jgi:hypothetical protein
VIGLDGARAAIQRELPDTAVESLYPSSEDVPYYTAWVTRGFSPWTREGGGGNVLVAVDRPQPAGTGYHGCDDGDDSTTQASRTARTLSQLMLAGCCRRPG